ncbi:MAG: ABC transporter substrate-binding protein [Desulfobacteraceae bacterium]|nr:ABC transporter substrate-binding protein [Desulfobacteraceae bacterium]
MKKKFAFIILFFFVLSFECFALSPIESIKKPTENIISILKSEKYKNLSPELKEEQWNEIWSVVKDSFDFKLISRLALGKYWNSFSSDQQLEFQKLFAELLANTYINKVQENFKNQKVTYIDEKIDQNKAEVLVHVALEDKPVPIIYRMLDNNGWLIFDVKIEGMSMIKNYRSQFDEYLFKKKPEELITALKSKISQLREERKKPVN